MRTIGKVIGNLLLIVAAFLMFNFWYQAMRNWLGFLGEILAFVISPGLVILPILFVIFPIVFWIVEGVFPAFYFIILGIGIVGLIITVISIGDE